ncbi:EpsG family protein [Shewanella sp. HL-SH5]|uniref:EpsG family protein n=1 Tax=Shewanella sp. HL-SH5 TaxID=3436241 RepID=UPI003EB986C1
MIVYYAPIIFVLVSLVFLFVRARGVNLLLSTILVLFVTFITGSNYYAVSDYDNYIELYNSIPDISVFKFSDLKYYYGEIGFVYLVSLLKYFSIPFVAFTLVLSFISIALKSYFYAEFNKNAFYSISMYLCLYFILVEFIVIRWSVAVAFILVGYCFIFSKKYIYGMFFLLCSSVFHYFSLMFIVLSLFINRFFSFRLYLVSILSVTFVSSLLSLLDLSFISSFDTNISTTIAFYVLEKDTEIGLISRAKVFIYAVIILFYLGFKSRDYIDKSSRFLINSSMIFIFFSILFFEFPALFQRATVITDVFCIATLVRIAECKLKGNIVSLFYILLSFALVFILWSFIDVNNSYNIRVWDYESWSIFLY